MTMPALPNGLSHAPDSNHTVAHAPTMALQNATSEAEIRNALAALHARESSITSRLEALVASQADLSRDLGRLDLLRAGLGAQVIAARSVGNDMLAGAADTAGRLSDKVKELDLEKSRVEDTLRVVEQVAELKACVNGVVGSMGAPQDWEAAAGYLSRASQVPEDIIKGSFASDIVPSVEVPDPPWVTLENSRESLCGLFLREFEKATEDGDEVKVTRFFKLFPLIGRSDTGLDVYGRYVCQGVAGHARATLKSLGSQARTEGLFYATALTKLFEHVAQIVEGHGGLVERHYGPGKMVRVIDRLQMEVDVQGGIVIDTWSDERGIGRKLTDVKSYPFSFLAQNVRPPQSRTGTPRVNSPAPGQPGNPRESEDEGVNMREVDGLLSEISVMLGHWALYTRFLAAKCRDPTAPDDAPLAIPDVLVKSNLYRKVANKLISPYEVMTTFFFRRSVEKAFQMDEYPTGLSLSMSRSIEANSPFIIMAVDVVMYIVNGVIDKSIRTSQRDVIAAVIPAIERILTSDFIRMMQNKMINESYPKATVQGGFPPEDKIIQFIVLINSFDMSNEYLTRVINGRIGESDSDPETGPLKDSFPFGRDVTFVTTSLRRIRTSFAAKSAEFLNEGVRGVLFENVVKARLRPVLGETFRDVDYTLTEDDIADIAQQNDEDEEDILAQVPRRFEHGWDQLMKPIARLMTPGTYAMLLDTTTKYLAKIWEKRILSYSGRTNAFGAIRIERDFSALVDIVSRNNYAVREVFSRVTQLLMVANMEDEEWDELMALEGSEGIDWVLTEEERRKARNLVRN